MGDFKSDVYKNLINIFAGALIAGSLSVLGYIAIQQNMLAVSIAELMTENKAVLAKQENQIKLIKYITDDLEELNAYKREHDRYSVEAMKFILEKIKNVNSVSDERYAQVMSQIDEIKRYCYKSMEKN